MKTTIKKKVTLTINSVLRIKLEQATKTILDRISTLQRLSQDNLGIDLSNTDNAMEFIRTYTKQQDIESIELQNELLFQKFDSEVSKLMTDYPNLIKTKTLSMFCDETDRNQALEIINLAVSINIEIKRLNAEIDLEHFILNGEFIYNSKLDTRLKELYTTYCKNSKQVEVKELAEKISTIIKHAMKAGLISDTRLGTVLEDIMDLNTGTIHYNRISGIR